MKTVSQVQFTPKPERKLRVAAYARVSSGKDAMLHSLSSQVGYYSELIQKHGEWEYAGVYADEAVTGTKDSRNEYQRLLADCRAGRIELVLTKSISRFARNTVTLLQAVRELKALGVDVFFEEQNIHTMSGEGELMMTILASYAQEESRSVSENQKWRVGRNFEEGRPWNCTILGYRAKNGAFEVVPEEADTVRRIFAWYLVGFNTNAIANRLNELQVPTRMGREWHSGTIGKILRNEIYTGDLRLQKTFRTDYLTKRTRVNRGELPSYFVQEAHEPIIVRTTFDAVQVEMERRSKNYTVRQGSAPAFAGKIRCELCGKNYHHKETKAGAVWVCTTFNTEGKRLCASKRIPEETLKSVCSDVLNTKGFDEDTLKEKIDFITAKPGNLLEFHFKGGHAECRTWADRSRRESWTDEMRRAAADKTRQRSAKRCQEQ